MKRLILATAAVVALTSVAPAREHGAGVECPGAALAASGPQGPAPFKLAMGPTSAPHLPGGTGNTSDQTGSTTQTHKKSKHGHGHSSSPNPWQN